MTKKIKVLIVDDSALVRQVLKEIFLSDRNFEVIGTASDPYKAVKEISREVPDVITLDIEMPKMDGLTFLKKIMSQHPIPVVVISSLTQKGSETAIRALEYGAVDIISKPKIYTREFFEESKITIIDAVKAAAKVASLKKRPTRVVPKNNVDVLMRKKTTRTLEETTDKVIVIGASTGGTEALKYFLESMPYDSPGIVVVQHMPELFTKAFANRLDKICKISVSEAVNGDSVVRGKALIAPGNHHLILKRSGARYYVQLNNGPLINRHRPSVDVLFRSTAMNAGKNAIGIIMTGMGNDGAQGLLEMNEAGAFTIAQDEKSCVVYGMPKEAIRIGAVNEILHLDEIPFRALKIAVK